MVTVPTEIMDDAAWAACDLDLPGARGDHRIVVAMSGGVDSSLVAALLKSGGWDVVGITLQLYDHGAAVARSRACCAGQDIHDARRVADSLSIPHYVLDYEARFRTSVMEEFADSYLAGETPIPCIRCNQRVKFEDLLATARQLGASALATGHYIASRPRGDGSGHRDMLTAADENRDQSYFLFTTTQAQLDYLRFPLGEIGKERVRALARAAGLQVAHKPDSQDICFVPNGRYVDVIAKLRPTANRPGDIVDMDGRVLGRHRGIMNYTIGQRRGLGIASQQPLYVVRIESDANRVVVGPKSALACREVWLRDFNWLGSAFSKGPARDGMNVHVRVRSTQRPVPARLFMDDGRRRVVLDDAEDGISPGQACVIYERAGPGARVLGGGWIEATVNAAGDQGGQAVSSPAVAMSEQAG